MIVQPELQNGKKMRMLTRRLGSRGEVLWALVALWGHCQTSRSWTFDWDSADLAAVCDWQGEDEMELWTAFTDPAIRVLDQNEDGTWTVHNWAERNSMLVSKWRGGSRGGRPLKDDGQNQDPRTLKPNGEHAENSTPPNHNLTNSTSKPIGYDIPSTSEPISEHIKSDRIGEDRRGEERRITSGRNAILSSTAVDGPTGAELALVAEAPADPADPTPSPQAIYAAYPRHVGRVAALASIRRALQKKEGGLDADGLLARAKAFAAAVKLWPAQDLQFVPHPATWFNQGRYLDDPAEWVRMPAQKKEGGGFARPEKPGVAIPKQTAASLAAPPCDWRAVLEERFSPDQFPDADYTLPWGEYSSEIRTAILKVCKDHGLIDREWRQPK